MKSTSYVQEVSNLCDQCYRLTNMESGDVGCAVTSAKRRLAGSAPGMTALVEAANTYRAPKVRHCLPPSR